MYNYKFVIITEDHSGLPIALKLQKEGYDVYYSLAGKKRFDEKAQNVGKGLLKNIVDFENLKETLLNKPELAQDHLIIFDMVVQPLLADRLKELGYYVLGSGIFNDQIEHHREIGIDLMKKNGINYPETYFFNSFEKGIEFLKNQKDNYVFKPNNKSSELTTIARNNEELIEELETFSKKYKKIDFILQKKVENEIAEISIEGWFDGFRFNYLNATLERKREATGDLGAMCGSAGDVVFAIDRNDKIFKEGLAKIEPYLREINFHGMIDLNSLIDEDNNFYGLEWTPRFGWNASMTWLSLLKIGWGEFLIRFMTNNLSPDPFSKDYGISVRVIRRNKIENIPIDYPKEIEDNIKLWDAMKNEKGKLTTAGFGNEIMIVTSQGKDIYEAKRNLYEITDKIFIPDKEYRIDIGDKAIKYLNNLIENKWILSRVSQEQNLLIL